MRLLDDIRQTLRSLARSKLATAVLLVSLAVGTGVNATLYTVMDALLFRPPAGVAGSSRLAWVHTSQFNGASYGPSSYPDFLSMKQAVPSFQQLAAFDDSQVTVVRLGDNSQRVRVVSVSPEFFSAIGMGTVSLPAAGAVPPAVVSEGLWRALGGSADPIGQPLLVAGAEYTVGSVAPSGFAGLQMGRTCDVWIPLPPASAETSRGDRRLSIVGHLKDGADLADVSRELAAASARLAAAFPETNKGTRSDADEPRRLTATPYSRLDAAARGQVLLISVVVLGSTGLLLLSACVNAGSLLLSRSAARHRPFCGRSRRNIGAM